ncbi:Uncharacterised protein [Mycobacteroides abscessus subsp. abscessus]|nr:Uncharacterised protein [Mycobacteroides abscessus subsp. abscessus]
MVPPWTARDRAATAKAMKISTERIGVSSGRVWAAATVTAPRIPAHTTIPPSAALRGRLVR